MYFSNILTLALSFCSISFAASTPENQPRIREQYEVQLNATIAQVDVADSAATAYLAGAGELKTLEERVKTTINNIGTLSVPRGESALMLGASFDHLAAAYETLVDDLIACKDALTGDGPARGITVSLVQQQRALEGSRMSLEWQV
ncbi:uncharacterized protein BDV14DRAFT_202387 [Aspergillus stella-maris]|uniref:uncharacterized protein n=1 Tax=Aspergillus stella-maris TaxID=1810926 RepID=UPI003CCCE43C